MSLELEQPDLNEQFEQLIEKEDKLEIREFLDHQNISDVAGLINDFPEYEAQIIANMAIHRAASVFKILDIAQQKDIVKELVSQGVCSRATAYRYIARQSSTHKISISSQ